MATISFFASKAKIPAFNRANFRKSIAGLLASKKRTIGEISYIFCTDEELLSINKQYLNHNTYTDIITFDYTEKKIISGDIFISVERVKENAKKFNTKFSDELLRVMAHGILHLLGMKDKTPAEATKMRKAEDAVIKKIWQNTI
jgi:rRNA maturation RNase YbeY